MADYIRPKDCSAALIGLVMRLGTFRFSKDYRHGVSRYHRTVYALVNTVAANYVADGTTPRVAVFWGLPSQWDHDK